MEILYKLACPPHGSRLRRLFFSSTNEVPIPEQIDGPPRSLLKQRAKLSYYKASHLTARRSGHPACELTKRVYSYPPHSHLPVFTSLYLHSVRYDVDQEVSINEFDELPTTGGLVDEPIEETADSLRAEDR